MNTLKNNEMIENEMIENEMIENLEPEKRKRGRPRKFPDQPPIVRSKIRGHPRKYVNGETASEVRITRYENGYAYFGKLFYLKNRYDIPEELLNIKCETIGENKEKYLKWLEYVNAEKFKKLLDNPKYMRNQRKNKIAA